MRTRRRSAWGLMLVSSLVPAACGSEDPGGDATTSSTTSASTGSSASTSPTTVDPSTSTGDVASTGPGPTSTSAVDSTTVGSDGPGPIFDLGRIPDSPGNSIVPTDIDAVLTADNAYAFGYGTEDEMLNYFGGVAATLAAEIFSCATGPEQYLVPAEDVAEYLYIVSYADQATTQGVIGQFRRLSDTGGMDGDVLYTGDEGWEVCATGVDYNSGDPTPSLMVVNEQIALCNAGMTDPTTTSGGWVDAVGTSIGALAVGETNETPYAGGPQPGNEFPLVCQTLVDPEARWMWFNWDPDDIMWPAQSPFIYPGGGGNPMHDFMVFRLAAEVLPPPPAG
ncbi:hypothetical protein [Paraliomyxa miuraensis]|uniref:hypothetical protein n=1 Tax=Paraliomyxa miuraensis TaxID=376150 RepID=UPI00225863B8|nr:hypothetical protein [Paraliomyxa miuraensis]MCX4244721.1 hypothetical protein [Paraliomyxa miuraensis]